MLYAYKARFMASSPKEQEMEEKGTRVLDFDAGELGIS
jgi:hypothetical protein